MNKPKKCCCNCINNTILKNETNSVKKHICKVDKHQIDYAESFSVCCEHWNNEFLKGNKDNE